LKGLQKLPVFLSNGWQFIKLYLLEPIRVDQLAGTVR
jgi:magnesium-protoporphyrin IX monomethyl ester (oxidative) cyclase